MNLWPKPKHEESDDLETKVQVLNLRPGDILAITTPGHITLDQANRIKAQVTRAIPKVQVMVFEDGMQPAVIKPPAPAEPKCMDAPDRDFRI